MIDDDLFTCDTPLGTIFNEFNQLSGMDEDMFTYEVKIPVLSYSLSVGQQIDDLDNGNLDVYERKLCYDECEKMYAKAVLFINKRLLRLSDVNVEQWLDLKYGNHTMVSNEVKESVIATWLIRSYKKQFKEYMEVKKQKENMLWIYWTRGDDEEVIMDDELSNLKDANLIEETKIAEIFRIETYIFQFETPLWVDEESSDNARTHCSSSDEWDDFERANHVGTNANSNCNPYLDVSIIFNDYARTNNVYETQENEGWFDEHKLMGDDDDDIDDFEDYLIHKDSPYYVNEEEQ
nr:hypothetical protein [Tanacetum cinerariifolium]